MLYDLKSVGDTIIKRKITIKINGKQTLRKKEDWNEDQHLSRCRELHVRN